MNNKTSFLRGPWLRILFLIACLSAHPAVRAESVTLNLKDVDIGVLIETVAEVTGTNFVVDPRVKGKATVISSRPMNAEEVYQVFLSILKVHGYSAVPAGEVVKIVPDVSAKQDAVPTVDARSRQPGDAMVTRVVQVENVAAAQLVPILRPLVPQQGHLAAYPATNVLIITDRADNVRRLVTIIHRIDQKSNAEIEVIPLQHASAAEVVRILTALQRTQPAKKGQPAAGGPALIADERTNSVLLGGDRAERLRLRAVISHLDTPLERGGNTHVVYLKYAKAEDMVKVLTGVSATIEKGQKKAKAPASKAFDVSIQADESANALVITAPPDILRSLLSVVRQLDIRRAQVHVEGVIAEIRLSTAAELGVQWQVNAGSDKGVAGGTNFSGTGSSIRGAAVNPLSVGDGLALGYIEGTSTLLGTEILNMGALIKALASDNATNILSTPNLVTLDNEEAEIVVAQNIPFITGSYVNTGAAAGQTTPFQTIQRQDVGLTLKVTPQINEGNAIQLDIEQEISNVSNETVKGAADVVTAKRSIKTSVLVEDGQIIVLGGLIDDQLVENIQKVPFLGDIPVLGHLFKSRGTRKEKRNLMVFIRPTILRDAALINRTSRNKYNYIRAQELRQRELGVNLLPDDEAPLLPEYGKSMDGMDETPAPDPAAGQGAP